MAPDLYATFKNGLAYKYVPGHTLNVNTVIEPNIYRLVAKRMAQLHKAGHTEGNFFKPFIWDKLQKFLNIVPEVFSHPEKQKRYVITHLF